MYVNGRNVYSVHITAKQTPREIIVTPCKNLKELKLCEVVITDGWLCKQISELPFLEYLYVKYCGKLRNVKIISPRLKKLDFTSTEKLVELRLNTPNLSMFKTSGSMVSFSSNALALSETVFYYMFYVDKYVKLIELLAKFDHRYEVLNLICNHKVYYSFQTLLPKFSILFK